MAQPFHHAISSAKKWGGEPTDYLAIHEWFDESREHTVDPRHRFLRHHTLGVIQCEEFFGPTVTNSKGTPIPTRSIAEQHIVEDVGFVPTLDDWAKAIDSEAWMHGRRSRFGRQKP